MMGATWRWLTSRSERRGRRKLREWIAAGRPAPPPSSVKRAIILEYATRHGLRTFVETGTYRGDTIEAVRGSFDRIYSIELEAELHALARARFAGAPHVTILHGDSAEALPALLPRLTAPTLFWLDGHYSGPGTAKGRRETPIVEETRAVLAHPVAGHVVLVDDARAFGTWPDYPTLEEFRRLVAAANEGLVFAIADDVIRIHPPAA